MKKNNGKNKGDMPLADTVSANEYTGSLQKISTDPREIRLFHDQYIGEDN